MKEEFPKRKNIRLKEYDYNTAGACFVTFCTHNRRQILSKIVPVGATHESPVPILTVQGELLEEILQHIPDRFSCQIDNYVIMPNHVHLLVSISGEARAIHESPLRNRSDLSKMIGYIKMNASKRIRQQIHIVDIWQRGYYDHVIRNQADYDDIYRYIENNPTQWEQDEFYQA